MRQSGFFGLLASSLIWATTALAGPVRIDHTPIKLHRAQLTVSGPTGETAYTPAQLEEIGFMRMTTVTPWREAPAAFDGVLLSDLLAANGLADASAINVVAENDYVVRIPADVWERWPILVATRLNGNTLVGREDYQNNWVWMAARIEAIYE